MGAEGVVLEEFVEPPAGGRTFALERRPLLGDCAPSGRLRLDALSRMLQDVAYLDVDDAGVAELAVWVVRRSRVQVRRFPRFGELLTLTTYCSGLGRMWAERRTSVAAAGEAPSAGGDGPGAAGEAPGVAGEAPGVAGEAPGVAGEAPNVIEAVSLWVHLDPQTWRPAPFTPEEVRAYGAAAAGRRITARLRHPVPDAAAPATPWAFRASECDVADHVNNAAYWVPLEEELLGGLGGDGGRDLEALDVEIEFRTPAQPGEKRILREGNRRWIVGVDGEAHASILVR